MQPLDLSLFAYSVVGLVILGSVGTGILALYTAISKEDYQFGYKEMRRSFLSLWVVPTMLVARRFGLKKKGFRRCFSRYHAGPFNYISIWMITLSSMLTFILWAWWTSNMSGVELPTQIWWVWGLAITLQTLGISMSNIYTTIHRMQEELGCEIST